MNLNRILLAGRLTRDVQTKRLDDGTALATFGLAINRKYKTRTGASGEDVLFVDCEAWGRTAEMASEHLFKGATAFIEGRLRFSTWDEHGTTRSKITVTVDRFEYLGAPEKAKA